MFMPPGLMPTARYKRRELFETVPKLLVRSWPRIRRGGGMRGYINCNTVYNIVLHDRSPGRLRRVGMSVEQPGDPLVVSKGVQSEESLFPHIQKYQLPQIPLPRLDGTNRALANWPGWATLRGRPLASISGDPRRSASRRSG